MYLSLHGVNKGGFLNQRLEVRVLVCLCVCRFVSACVFQPPVPLPEAHELGSSAQSADMGAWCAAPFIVSPRALLCSHIMTGEFPGGTMSPGGHEEGRGYYCDNEWPDTRGFN